MKIRLSGDLLLDSIVDGQGIRTVIWTQGCIHNCLGCHNPETHSFEGGKLVDIKEIKERISKLEGQDGITFSGGDPMCQPKECAVLAKYAKDLGFNIWCYTGYTYETLLAKEDKDIMDFLKQIDVLVDGPFILKEKSLAVKFRGSKNQRLIDVKESLSSNRTILFEEEMEFVKNNKKKVYI